MPRAPLLPLNQHARADSSPAEPRPAARPSASLSPPPPELPCLLASPALPLTARTQPRPAPPDLELYTPHTQALITSNMSAALEAARAEGPKTHRLFGMPLHGTYAPFLHNTITRLAGVPRKYTTMESTDMDAFLAYLRSEECAGSAVTMPHKVAICQHLDDLTEDGRNIGACNTVIIRKGPNGERQLVGHNTDSVGVRESLLHADDSHVKSGKVRPGAVLGAGGACRAAVYALTQWLNCSPIYVVNRDDAEVEQFISDFAKASTDTFKPQLVHVKTVEQAEALAAPAYIVSAVPAFPPTTPEEKQARAVSEALFAKPEKGVVLEMAYHPEIWTELAGIAQAVGWKVVTGEQAMIWQGIEQQLLWLGVEEKDLPVQEILDTVAGQVASDKKTKAEPPLE